MGDLNLSHGNTMVYMRTSLQEEREFEYAGKSFRATDSRLLIHNNSLVIPRYSALPFYEELESDMKLIDCELINSYAQHKFVADIKNWYPILSDLTPNTYFNLGEVPEQGPFVQKWATNSRKNLWKTHMFANNKKEAIEVYRRLLDDSMISEQDIVIRDYVPLKKLAEGINGLPISEEYRIFFLNHEPIAMGFYWQNFADDLPSIPDINNIPYRLIEKIGQRICSKINFYVADVARTESGEWVVIELNDGQMSGLSCIEPDVFYESLSNYLNKYSIFTGDHLLACLLG